MPNTADRDALLHACFEENLLIMPCGTRTIRVRPALDVSAELIDQAGERLAAGLRRARKKA